MVNFFTPTTTAAIVIVVLCWFIFWTRESLKRLIDKIVFKITKKDLSVSSGHEQSDQDQPDKANLSTEFETYKFGFLNYFLVPNSKLALLWFFRAPSTKDHFDLNFPLQSSAENLSAEKAAILNALLSHGLIILSKNGQYTTTPVGTKFLRLLNMI